MTYEECLNELNLVGLKDKFEKDFENTFDQCFLQKLKEFDKINSVGSLIRTAMSEIEVFSEKWEYWKLVLVYYLTPIFERDKNKLPKI